MSATDKVLLTLPTPVTAAVSWDDVQAYLRAEGWRQEPAMPDMWLAPDHGHNGSRCVLLGSAPGDEERRMGVAVSWMAHLASVSPGEMLARIAGQKEQSASAAAENMRARCAAYIDTTTLWFPARAHAVAAILALPLTPDGST